MFDEFLKLVDKDLGPIRFEGNRRAVVCMVACSLLRGVPDVIAFRYGKIVGNHTLTQERIDRSLKLSKTKTV